jgi:hypothetical protein
MRTIDTRLSRLIEQRRHLSARPGRPLPKGPVTPPEEDEHAGRIEPFDDWPFDFAPLGSASRAGGRR